MLLTALQSSVASHCHSSTRLLIATDIIETLIRVFDLVDDFEALCEDVLGEVEML